ncbi:dihydropteroate synthase [Anaerotruncus rubiinfantis]|jgi:cobalamin-dependent methionine synthase I|uniref:dihydropteroate synthase n=1 Tax=Anaerotruncus rubiinfantis TaxID=1720200 RepID=UPI00189AE37C|nr:dihydropteroate synthase [Anaerotruncus rubiinfantis]
MILIGEKLNSSIPAACEAMNARDEASIVALIRRQADAGARFLDVNTAICGEDALDRMLWVIGLIKSHCDCGIMIDTTDEAVMSRAVEAAAGRELILNSATIDERFGWVTALARESGAAVVGLPIDADGMPHSLEDKCGKIDLLVKKLREAGFSDEKIYVDVLVETLATGSESARNTIGAVRHVREHYPDVKTTCGLSNVSFGLPRRALVNAAFLSAAVFTGLSSAIIDPASPAMRDALAAANVVAGLDDYCMEYITYIRSQEA